MINLLIFLGLLGPIEVAVHPLPRLTCGIEYVLLSTGDLKIRSEIWPEVKMEESSKAKAIIQHPIGLVIIQEFPQNELLPICNEKAKRYFAMWSVKILNTSWSISAPWEQGE